MGARSPGASVAGAPAVSGGSAAPGSPSGPAPSGAPNLPNTPVAPRGPTVACPGCGERLPAEAKVCVFCATNLKTGKKIKTVKAALPAEPQRIFPGAADEPRTGRVVWNHLFAVPFSRNLLSQAATILVGVAAWCAIGLILAIAVTMVARGSDLAPIAVTIILVGITLAAGGWAARHCFAIAREYFRAQPLSLRGFSVVGSLLRLLAVAIIALLPGALLLFLAGVRSIDARSLDHPTGAVVGAYGSLNPLTVFDRVKMAFGPYVVVLLFGGVLLAAAAGVSWIAAEALTQLQVHGLIALVVLWFLLAVLSQYAFAALEAMLGAVLRQYPDPGTPVPLQA
jgi:hypothetical protein